MVLSAEPGSREAVAVLGLREKFGIGVRFKHSTFAGLAILDRTAKQMLNV
jgi:hypothetical protein